MKIMSLGLTRALIAGFVGFALGMAVTMGVRVALGYPAWEPASVSAAGTIVATLAFLVGVGAFTDWWAWSRGAEAGDPPHWQDYLARLAHGVRRIALIHPEVFPLIATRPPAAPWLRPPLRSLKWMEFFLSTLRSCGFTDEAAVAAYRGFSSFLLGHLLLEVSGLGADTSPVEQVAPDATPATDLSEYPLLQELEPMLAQNRSAEEFEKSLESLLDRLAAQR